MSNTNKFFLAVKRTTFLFFSPDNNGSSHEKKFPTFLETVDLVSCCTCEDA